jgi:hypothetical protein
LIFLSACGPLATSAQNQSQSIAAIADYCPYINSPRSFSPSITISGLATYEFRVDGNGAISDGFSAYSPAPATSSQTYSITINGLRASWTCNTTADCSANSVVGNLAAQINSNSAQAVTASGFRYLSLIPKTAGQTFSVSGLQALTAVSARPIRFAEVRVSDASGQVTQCGETAGDGSFSLNLPADGNSYQVAVTSRSDNAHNTAYVMNNPMNNSYYQVSTSVIASANPAPVQLVARASGNLIGGAFNILDQILNAQEFLRTQTAGCGSAPSPNYRPGCQPFSADLKRDIVNTYWTPGLSPGIYQGTTAGVSYYLMGKSQLYILGGVDGDTDSSDMDQFDDSVIIHEYGHFIEDHFGKPDTPGGSHSGNAIIDPRLAWGEGWADFFQAAVTGVPYYRDTYGHVGCGDVACTGVFFNEVLDPSLCASGDPICYQDVPTTGSLGEGNYHEFSITRALWSVIKPSAGVSQFSEIWTTLNGSDSSMRTIDDHFKSLGRFDLLQSESSGHADWSSAANSEEQITNLSSYAAPLLVASGCSPTSSTMTIQRFPGDDGSFTTSNMYQNNRFFSYQHSGGPLNVQLSWSGSSSTQTDLDLYLYESGYVFGDANSILASDSTQNPGVSGTADLSTSLPAGRYLINVMAYTGGYTTSTPTPTPFTLTINGQTACPQNQ